MQAQEEKTPSFSWIEIIEKGDLFQSGMQTLVNPINCGGDKGEGVMGAGLAKIFKDKFPDMFADYKKRCKKKAVKLGEPYLWKSSPDILNFPTKYHWRNPSSLSDIKEGLDFLAANAERWGIRSLAIPALGCGLGGLQWKEVLPLIEATLGPLQIPIKIYKDGPALTHVVSTRKEKTKLEQSPSVVTDSIFKKMRTTQESTVAIAPPSL